MLNLEFVRSFQTPFRIPNSKFYRGPRRAGRANGSTLRRSSSSARPKSRVSTSEYAPTVSASLNDLSCSVGVSRSFSTMRCVISSTRARASGGSAESLKSSRSSSARRMVSKRSRRATTVGIAPRAGRGARPADRLRGARGVRHRAADDRDVPHVLRLQVDRGELAHLARAEDRDAAAVHVAENLLRERDGGVADRDGAGPEAG